MTIIPLLRHSKMTSLLRHELLRHYDVTIAKQLIMSINKQLITQLLSCIGAGALLGLAMIDILPELREKISSIPKESTNENRHGHHDSHHSDEEQSGFFSDHYPLGLKLG